MRAFYHRYEKIIKLLFYVLIFIAIGALIKHELKGINWQLFYDALTGQSWQIQVLLVLTGLLGFSVNGFYDVNGTRDYPINASLFDILKIGWISQAFNEFIDFGGLTGGTLRAKQYKDAGLANKDALQLTLMNWAASFLGLAFLVLIAVPIGVSKGLSYELILPIIYTFYVPLFLFADKIPWFDRFFEKHELQAITWRKKFGYILVSIADWTSAMSYFLFAMSVFNPGFKLTDGIMIYVTAIVVGIFSFVPGGVGAFDVTALLMMQKAGYETANVLAGLVVLRVCYYIIPWAAASFYVIRNWYRDKTDEFHLTLWSTILINVLSIAMFFVGILLMASALTPHLFARVHFLSHFVPRFFERISVYFTLNTGIVAVILSLGIHARVRRVYQIAMILLPIGTILYLTRGLDGKSALVILVLWAALYASRNQFIRNSVPVTRRNILLATFLALVVLGGTWLIVSYHVLHIHGELHINLDIIHLALTILIVVGTSLLILFSRSRKIQFIPPTQTAVDRYIELAKQYGGSEYSHLVHLYDKQIFFSPSGQSAILYRPSGRNLLALGDPVGEESDFDALLLSFSQQAHETNMIPSYYEVTPKYLDHFCNLGYVTVKIGESAIVDLTEFTFDGKPNKNRRMIRNAMINAELEYLVLEPPYSEDLMQELREISDLWLNGRSEMGYSLGAFREDYIQRTPIAILRSKDRIEAFANIMPISDDLISIDLMRFRADTVENVMQMLLLQLLDWSKNKGYHYFDLGMAPLANVGDQTFSRSRDRVIRLVYEYGNRIYGFKGLRAYKDKFRPEWDNRYLIYTESNALPQILLGLYDVINHPNQYSVQEEE